MAQYALFREEDQDFEDSKIEIYAVGSSRTKYAFIQKRKSDNKVIADLRFMDVNDRDDLLKTCKGFLSAIKTVLPKDVTFESVASFSPFPVDFLGLSIYCPGVEVEDKEKFAKTC